MPVSIPINDDVIFLFHTLSIKMKEDIIKNPFTKEVKVFDSKTNTTTSYPSIRKAASALNVEVKSLNRYINSKRELGL